MYRVKRVRNAIETFDWRNLIAAFVYDAKPALVSEISVRLLLSLHTSHAQPLHNAPKETFAVAGDQIAHNLAI